MESWSLEIYKTARDFAAQKGIIIADTKFEFGVDSEGGMVLVDEVLTPGMFHYAKHCLL
jgi:phosphoribosylaminoimidazole-succinocarboxamide synthase